MRKDCRLRRRNKERKEKEKEKSHRQREKKKKEASNKMEICTILEELMRVIFKVKYVKLCKIVHFLYFTRADVSALTDNMDKLLYNLKMHLLITSKIYWV